MDLASLLLLTTVGAGYGVPVDGYPSKAERQLVLWTNAARVAPAEFESEYSGCTLDDFTDDEKVAKKPLYIDLALTEVSRWHTEQMEENGCFQHESCDGSNAAFAERIADYYTESGYIGENIAMGTTDSRYAVMGMWMCSSGHRANIMTGDYNEMGPGISGSYLTQDFSAGTLSEGEPPVRMAVDDGNGAFYADWADDDAPAALQIVIEGIATDLALAFGEAEQGIYEVEAEQSQDGGCQAWYAYWETASGEKGTFPEDGSWLLGGDCDADWTEAQAPRGGLFGDVPEGDLKSAMMGDVTLVGCATVPGSLGLVGVLAAAAAGLRRGSRARGRRGDLADPPRASGLD
jgi:hypothetical protein